MVGKSSTPGKETTRLRVRLAAEACRLSCAARIACVRGPVHRYSDAQLAFHMAASMPRRA